MRFIKGFILGITGLFIVITLFSLLMPSKVMTVKTVVIHSKPENVFVEIADLGKWKHWHPLFTQDSSLIKISIPSSGVNATAEWTSTGKQNKIQITEVLTDQLKTSLSRSGENDINNIISVTALNDSNNVQVEWRVITKLKWYPWEKFSGIFVEKMTGPGYETALNNLKELIESE